MLTLNTTQASIISTQSKAAVALAKRKSNKRLKAKWIAPLLVSCVALLIGTLLMFPMLKMQPHNIPVGILNLDEGFELDGKNIAIGQLMMDSLLGEGDDDSSADYNESDAAAGSDNGSTDSLDSIFDNISIGNSETQNGLVASDSVSWIEAESEADLQELLDSGQCYAILTIPKNFSQSVVASGGKTALGNELIARLPELAQGTEALCSGTQELSNGISTLSSAMTTLDSGIQSFAEGTSQVPQALGSASLGADSLSSGLSKLQAGAASLGQGAKSLEDGTKAANQAVAAAIAALGQSEPDVQLALRYLAGANQAVEALGSGSAQVADYANALSEGLSASAQGAAALGTGLDKATDSSQTLVSGSQTLMQGSSSLVGGLDALSAGADSLSNGLGQLSEGLVTANNTLEKLPQDVDDPSVCVVINQGKNPMVSNSLGSALSSMGASAGIAFDTSYINELPSEMSMGYTHMILMLLTYISSYATAVITANLFKLRRENPKYLVIDLFVQLLFGIGCALIIGFGAASIVIAATGASIAFTDLALFIAIASLSFQLLVVGSLDLFGMPGMVVPIGLLVVGMGTAYLPTEFLPSFWQNWIYPWDPLRFMVDGFRGVLYMGQGFANPSVPPLLIMAGFGLVLMVLGAVKLLWTNSRKRAGTTGLQATEA